MNEITNKIYKFAKYKGLFGEKNKLQSPLYQKYKPVLPLSEIDSRILISHKYKFLFVRIPKAGQSTVVASLYHAETGKKLESTQDIQPIKMDYYEHPSSLNRKQFEHLQNNYFKFVFVRHPYTRLLSAFFDKITSNESKKENIRKATGKKVGDIEFGDFISFLERKGPNTDPHWARQIDILTMPLEEFDFIGKLENIKKDLPNVLKSIYGRKSQIVSVRNHATESSKKIKILSRSEKERIYNLYRPSFEAFGYSK